MVEPKYIEVFFSLDKTMNSPASASDFSTPKDIYLLTIEGMKFRSIMDLPR